MKACIILPTYNEATNIQPLLKELFSETKKIKKWDISILVVDDSSPDGTGTLVKKLQKKHSQLHLLEGKKQGLGVAYIKGMQHAMKELKPDAIFEMDADFSHPTKLIPTFLSRIEKGADFVIGSRYIKGGATPDWPLSRKLISSGGNFFARVIAGLHKVHDCTSGYRCISTKLLQKINLKQLGAKGYSFQMNLLYEAQRQGANIQEIPLVFHDRTRGKSKMRQADIIEFFCNAIRLGFKTWSRLIKFAFVGGTGILVDNGVLSLTNQFTELPEFIQFIISGQVAIIWNFILNDNITFRNAKAKKSFWQRFASFESISIVGVGIKTIIATGLTILGTNIFIANNIGIIIAFIWNYIANVKITWKK